MTRRQLVRYSAEDMMCMAGWTLIFCRHPDGAGCPNCSEQTERDQAEDLSIIRWLCRRASM